MVTLEEDYDAALIVASASDNPEVLIFNRYSFEGLFSFIEYYQKEVESKIDYINKKALFDNTDALIEICKKDARKIKKLAKIIKSDIFISLDGAQIRQDIVTYNLSIVLDRNGIIKVNESDIWSVLRILDDDCVKSDVTGNKYLAHAKIRV